MIIFWTVAVQYGPVQLINAGCGNAKMHYSEIACYGGAQNMVQL